MDEFTQSARLKVEAPGKRSLKREPAAKNPIDPMKRPLFVRTNRELQLAGEAPNALTIKPFPPASPTVIG
jgi:hypothetical protein